MEDAREPRRSILIVDDEEDILVAMEMLLKHAVPGAQVYTADSGPQALDLLSQVGVDLIVTDYRMPGMNGLEFLERAQRIRPAARSVLISAYAQEAEMARAAHEMGVERFLSKSMEAPELLHALRELLSTPADRFRTAPLVVPVERSR